MAKLSNIYDLVERAKAAARVGTPRLELWQKVARALLSGELRAANLTERIGPAAATTFFDWLGGSPISLGGFRASVDRGNDPNRVAHILRRIMVSDSDFAKWLHAINVSQRNKGGRPSARDAVYDELKKMQDEKHDLTLPQKKLAEDVAKRLGKSLGNKGWNERTVIEHVSKWLRDNGLAN